MNKLIALALILAGSTVPAFARGSHSSGSHYRSSGGHHRNVYPIRGETEHGHQKFRTRK